MVENIIVNRDVLLDPIESDEIEDSVDPWGEMAWTQRDKRK